MMEALQLDKRSNDQTAGVLEAKSVHTTFDDLFELAPTSTAEWVRMHGKDFADDTEQERALLGTGTYADTYRVRAKEGAVHKDIRAGIFAAKVVKLMTLKRLGIKREAMEDEANALRELKHHHVVRLLGFFPETKKFSLVMELASGGSLAERIPPMAPEAPALLDVYRWVLQLVEAVAYIHDMGVFHRDIKPENVLLSERGRAPLPGKQR